MQAPQRYLRENTQSCRAWCKCTGHVVVQFSTEQYGTNMAEKAQLRNLGKYPKDPSFKYLNESMVPFISVGTGKEGHIRQMRIWPWICSLEELLWAMTHSCKASGNVLTIPRLYVGGCIPLSMRDGYMEMTGYSATWLTTWLWLWRGVSHLLQIQSQQVALGEEWHCRDNKRFTTAWLGRNNWVWRTPSALLGVIK